MDIKKQILSAYGICDLLYRSINHIDMRTEMNRELLYYFFQGHLDINDTLAFAKEYLLFDEPLTKSQLEQILDEPASSVLKKEGSQVLYDFEWADEYLSALHAGMSYSAKDLYQNILDQLQSCPLPFKNEPKEKAAAPAPEKEPESKLVLSELLAQLNSLTGLDSVKKQINHLVNFIQISNLRRQNGLKTAQLSHHLVFIGNPGTGKTTIARLLAKIYKELGILSKGQLVETDRSGLVAGYIGQTAIKTKEMIDKAKGGILFIDEAYALARESKNDFGQEAIDTLLKQMEDQRCDFAVIVAGYPKPMENFLNSNPGLKSRFATAINFEDYTMEQLLSILNQMAEELDYQIEPDALDLIRHQLKANKAASSSQFGNAREVRNLLEHAFMRQASRLMNENTESALDTSALSLLKKEDFTR